MNRLAKPSLLSALMLTCAGGCDAATGFVGNILQPNTVTVELVNNGDFDVEARLFIGDNQDTLEALLTGFGEEINRTVQAGRTVSFTRDCEELQAVILEKAELRVIGEAGPETDSEILRDGTDFGCGDTIVFTFDHSAIVLDFDVTVSLP